MESERLFVLKLAPHIYIVGKKCIPSLNVNISLSLETSVKIYPIGKKIKFCIGLNKLQLLNINIIDIVRSQTWSAKKEHSHLSRLPDLGVPPDFVLLGDVE